MAAEIVLREEFTNQLTGAYININYAILEDPSGTFGIKRDDTDEVVITSGTPMVKLSDGFYEFEFDEPIGEDGLTYTYWIKWVYQGHVHHDEHHVTGGVTDELSPIRNTDKYLNWIENEFAPIELITPDKTIKQQIENAIRYWNTHSAYKCVAMYEYAHKTPRIQVSPEFKMVVEILPAKGTTNIFEGHPLWTLTGVTLMDSVRTDLIMMAEGFRNYKQYIGANFRWDFVRSDDPASGGFVYAKNIPNSAASLCVIGTKRILRNENIKSQYILDWILRYTKALVMMIEGNTLRKTMIIDTPIDGAELVREGREDMLRLQTELARDSRWVIMAQRK